MRLGILEFTDDDAGVAVHCDTGMFFIMSWAVADPMERAFIETMGSPANRVSYWKEPHPGVYAVAATAENYETLMSVASLEVAPWSREAEHLAASFRDLEVDPFA